MTRARGVGAWVLPVTGAVALAVTGLVRVVPEAPLPLEAYVTPAPQAVDRYPVDSFGRAVVARDVFRADRRGALVPYDPARGAAPLPDGPPKPLLALTGIVWGGEPEAVIEGLPTASGARVVRTGDVVGGVTIKRIDSTRVVATGFDTTWTLTVRQTWK